VYIPTAKVLDHFEQELDRVLDGGVLSADGKTRLKPRIALLAGADLIQTMSQPEVWSWEDLEHILGRFGAFIIERAGTDIHQALSSLQRYRENIHVIQQVFQNNMSSTQIRLHIKRDMSVRYCMFFTSRPVFRVDPISSLLFRNCHCHPPIRHTPAGGFD
jgi:nicotinamide mononucleotide adenylyltransferase